MTLPKGGKKGGGFKKKYVLQGCLGKTLKLPICKLQITYFVPFINFVNDISLQLSRSSVDILDQFTFLGNCPPTPPPNHHFAVREK